MAYLDFDERVLWTAVPAIGVNPATGFAPVLMAYMLDGVGRNAPMESVHDAPDPAAAGTD